MPDVIRYLMYKFIYKFSYKQSDGPNDNIVAAVLVSLPPNFGHLIEYKNIKNI